MLCNCRREFIEFHECQDERYDGGSCSVRLPCLSWFNTQADCVLGRLKDVTDVTKVAPDGQTIEGRMQQLCAAVAEDIKKCANTCDTYLKLVEIRSVSFMLTLLLERRSL